MWEKLHCLEKNALNESTLRQKHTIGLPSTSLTNFTSANNN